MARPSDEPELESMIADYRSVHLTAHIMVWKDTMGEKDWLDSSPAERLLQKQAADWLLYLDDDGLLDTHAIPYSRLTSASARRRVDWNSIEQEMQDRVRRRVDREKRGLVVPRSPIMKGESVEDRVL
ncbi:MAG: hypothetical protein Q9175_000490 [Cornicularia normoerica]